jgi:hypothetical protein
MTPRSSLRRSAVLAVIAAMLVACGSNTPTASPSASPTASPSPSVAPSSSPSPPVDSDTVFAAIEDQVVAIRRLEPGGPVPRQVIDEPDLVELVKASFEEDNPADYVAAYGRLLQHLALMPEGSDLGELYLELLGSQVIGVYDPDLDQLYVVVRDGRVGPTAKVTFAHEFTHALQDQHFDLNKLQPLALDEGDQGIARVSIAEGDATLLMTLWLQQHLTPDEIQSFLTETADPDSMAVLLRMPVILRETLQFPYSVGLNFVGSMWQTGDWEAVNAIYEDPPSTTEAVMHPEKYVAREPAIDVTVDDGVAAQLGNGWSEVLQDTLGEFQLSIWIREAGKVAVGPAATAAAGWGGDRLALYEGPDGAWAVVVETAWDTDQDATEFVAEAKKIVVTLDENASADVLQRDPSQASIVIGSDDATLGRLANALGLAG